MIHTAGRAQRSNSPAGFAPDVFIINNPEFREGGLMQPSEQKIIPKNNS